MSDLQQMLDADVLTLGMAADEARRAQANGNVVTYLRVQVMTAADIRAGASVPEGAAEVRLHETPATLAEAVEQVSALRSLAGGRRVAAFSMRDLEMRRWAPMADVLASLADAGLQDVAELPIDLLDDASASLDALDKTGLTAQRLTVAQPVAGRKRDIITRAEKLMAEHPALLRFAPLPRMAPVDKPTTGYDDVRMVALARLALGARSIEVDWTLYGPKLAQVALTFGADHLDAVAATDDTTLGPRRATIEDVERNIRAAGFEPREHRPAV